MSPESLPHGGSGLKGDSLRRCGTSHPGKDLAGGVRFVSFALCGLGLGVVLLLSSFGLTLLTSLALLSAVVSVAQTARA